MFNNVLTDINSVFADSSWTSNNIDIYPDNYQGTLADENEYLRLNVMPNSSQYFTHGGEKNLSGMVAIKMFVKAGEGQSRLMAIADILDNVLQSKRLTNGTELGTSYMNVEGLDPANKSLYSASYIIPFKIHGD